MHKISSSRKTICVQLVFQYTRRPFFSFCVFTCTWEKNPVPGARSKFQLVVKYLIANTWINPLIICSLAHHSYTFCYLICFCNVQFLTTKIATSLLLTLAKDLRGVEWNVSYTRAWGIDSLSVYVLGRILTIWSLGVIDTVNVPGNWASSQQAYIYIIISYECLYHIFCSSICRYSS